MTIHTKKEGLEKLKQKIRHVFTIEYLTDLSSKFVNQLQLSNKVTPTVTKTLPLALNILFIIGNYGYDFLELDILIRHFILITKRISSLNIHIGNIPEWIKLATRLHFALYTYRWIGQQSLLGQEDLKEFTCGLIEFGLTDCYAPESVNTNGFNLFNNHFVSKALKMVTLKFNQKSSKEPIKRQNLFTFFQKDITKIMVDFTINVSHPKPLAVLNEGMSMFGIQILCKELLRWTLPPFLVKLDGQTEALLTGIMEFTHKPLKTAFEVSFMIQ